MLRQSAITVLLQTHIDAYKTYSYDALAKMITDNRVIRETVRSTNGRQYQLRVRPSYADDETLAIRVVATLSLTRRQARWWQLWRWVPVVVAADDFVMTTDGNLRQG